MERERGKDYEANAWATGVRADGTEQYIYGSPERTFPLLDTLHYAKTYRERKAIKGTTWDFAFVYVQLDDTLGSVVAEYLNPEWA